MVAHVHMQGPDTNANADAAKDKDVSARATPNANSFDVKSAQNGVEIHPNLPQFYAKMPHGPLWSHWAFSLLPQGCIWTLKMAKINENGK